MSNIPQNQIRRSRVDTFYKSINTNSSNTEFLAVKTVEKKLPKSKPKKPPQPAEEKEIKKSNSPLLNRKRDSTSESEEKNSQEKIDVCFNCSWKFPERMSAMRKNQHINKCFEGGGNLDRMQFLEEQKIKTYRNMPMKKLNELEICPVCGKNMQDVNWRVKQNHLVYCIKKII